MQGDRGLPGVRGSQGPAVGGSETHIQWEIKSFILSDALRAKCQAEEQRLFLLHIIYFYLMAFWSILYLWRQSDLEVLNCFNQTSYRKLEVSCLVVEWHLFWALSSLQWCNCTQEGSNIWKKNKRKWKSKTQHTCVCHFQDFVLNVWSDHLKSCSFPVRMQAPVPHPQSTSHVSNRCTYHCTCWVWLTRWAARVTHVLPGSD